MDLNLQTLAADLIASTVPAVVQARQIGNDVALAEWCNESSTFIVWRSSVSIDEIFDGIVWANFTPNPSPDGTAAWTNRALACQGKQFNLQTMIVGRESLNASKLRIRAGLQDALTDVPSGANGAVRAAGWDNVLPVLKRPATNAEAMFTTGTGTDAAPGILRFEGTISVQQVGEAMNLYGGRV
jgi:hypothetical protein